VLEQTGFAQVAAETDQRKQLRLFARDIVLRLERAAPLNAIVAEAARSEPELAELLDRMQSDRLKNLRALVDALARNGPLSLSKTEATETVWALTSPELHQLLTGARGWTRKRYVDWLARSLAELLLCE
jgi:xanthine dehydrogenase iron-sulfur cluster and FAD-binding subunit A